MGGTETMEPYVIFSMLAYVILLNIVGIVDMKIPDTEEKNKGTGGSLIVAGIMISLLLAYFISLSDHHDGRGNLAGAMTLYFIIFANFVLSMTYAGMLM